VTKESNDVINSNVVLRAIVFSEVAHIQTYLVIFGLLNVL